MAVLACAFALTSCGRGLPPLQSVAVSGDPDVLSRLQGAWYDHDWTLSVWLQARPSGLLMVRLPEELSLSNARTVGDEIHFSIDGHGTSHELSMRRLDAETVVFVPPGGEPSWCGNCTPRYGRLSVSTIVRESAQFLSASAVDAYEDGMDWLARVL